MLVRIYVLQKDKDDSELCILSPGLPKKGNSFPQYLLYFNS